MSQLPNNSGSVPNASATITEMPDLERVHSLIKAMYQQKELKESASKWLEELQKSVYAWQIADQLLIKRLDYESCYFAAQTLKTKIQYNFAELPLESYDSLKNSVIAHLANIDEKVIQTQLSLSITYICEFAIELHFYGVDVMFLLFHCSSFQKCQLAKSHGRAFCQVVQEQIF